LSHGSPRDPHARQGPRKRYVAQSRWFLERGYAVLIPMRRGYACSEGEWAESFGACADPDYFGAGRTTADDIRAAIEHVARRPEIDPHRIVLVGQSAGGFGSLALASTKPAGVVAVINFAGGRGSRKSGQVCAEDRLVDAVRRYGASVEVPTLWLYSENDGFFAPALARAMFDAFAAKKSTFVALPAFHT